MTPQITTEARPDTLVAGDVDISARERGYSESQIIAGAEKLARSGESESSILSAMETMRCRLPAPVTNARLSDLIQQAKVATTSAQTETVSNTVSVGAGVSDETNAPLIIPVSHDESEMVRAVIAGLASEKRLFQRGNRLVLVQETPEPEGSVRRFGTIHIAPINLPNLRERISRRCRFVKVEHRSGRTPQEYEVGIPGHVPAMVLDRAQWPGIPVLRGIAQHPVFVRGRVLHEFGYDRESGLFVAGDCRLNVSESPTQAEVEKAVRSLRYIVQDFPLRDPSHFSSFVAVVLSVLARHDIHGPVPLFLIDKTTPGCGGSLLADVIGLIVSGAPMPRVPQPGDDDEMRKRITAILLAGDETVLIDNATHGIGGSALDELLTAEVWRDRVLGKSEMTQELPATTVWSVTGNNLSVIGDCVRRVMPIRIESREERPETRTGFKIPDLKAFVREKRGSLLCSAMTILQAYQRAGLPDMHLTPWGSFESFSALIRNAIVYAGLPDPADARAYLLSLGDRSRNSAGDLLEHLERIFARRLFQVRDVVRAAEMGDDDLRDVIEENGWLDKGRVNPRLLGYGLKRLVGRNIRGRWLEHDTVNLNANRFRIVVGE